MVLCVGLLWSVASSARYNIVGDTLTLDSCLALALRNNRDLRRTALDIDKAREVKQQMFTKYFPQVSASAMGYHSMNPLVEVGVGDIANAGVRELLAALYGNYGMALGLNNTISLFQTGYGVGVTAIQPIYVGGKIVAANRLAKVGIEAAELQYQIKERDLLEQVEESYWLVVGLRDKQATLRVACLLLDTAYRTATAAVEAGLALQSDLLQLDLRRSELQRRQLQLDNGLRLATRALCQSIGIDYSDSLHVQTLICSADSMRPWLYDTIDVPSTPETELLALQLQAAALQRRMAISDALPQLAIGAHYGYGKLQADILRDGLGNRVGNGMVFFTLSLPLSAWGETGHKIKEHTLAVEQARLEQSEKSELLALRTHQAYDQLVEAQALFSETERALLIACDAYRLADANFRAGMGTITDLLAAQTAMLNAQNDLTDARIAYCVYARRYDDLTR